MTVIQPPSLSARNGTGDPNVKERLGSLVLLEDGRAQIEQIDGPVSTIRRPKSGEYRTLKIRFTELQNEFLAALAAVRAMPGGTDEEDHARAEALERATETGTERLASWWLEVNGLLVSPPLPIVVDDLDDPDAAPLSVIDRVADWPADIVEGYQVHQRLIDHWTHTPSVRGRAVRPAPTETTT